MNKANSRQRQTGFSLVELMISVTIGLVLIAGVAQVFVGSQQAYRTHDGVGRIQENGRFAIELMSRQIRLAGFRPNPLQPMTIFPANLAAISSTAVFGLNNVSTSGRVANSDVLILAYQGSTDGLTTDCQGNTVANGAPTVNAFFIHADRELRCTVNDLTGTAAGQPLLEGIADMQVLYGIDNSNCGTTIATVPSFQYVDAANVTNWCDVQSIRITLTVDSVNSVDPSLPNGGRLERTYASTVRVRNAP